MAPLYEPERQALRPLCAKALKRIFLLCDKDQASVVLGFPQLVGDGDGVLLLCAYALLPALLCGKDEVVPPVLRSAAAKPRWLWQSRRHAATAVEARLAATAFDA